MPESTNGSAEKEHDVRRPALAFRKPPREAARDVWKRARLAGAEARGMESCAMMTRTHLYRALVDSDAQCGIWRLWHKKARSGVS